MPLNTPSPLSLWSAPRRKVERSTLPNPFFAKNSCLDRESITVSTSSRALDQFSYIFITMSASNWVLWNRILKQRYFFPPTRMSFFVPDWWSNRVWTRVSRLTITDLQLCCKSSAWFSFYPPFALFTPIKTDNPSSKSVKNWRINRITKSGGLHCLSKIKTVTFSN